MKNNQNTQQGDQFTFSEEEIKKALERNEFEHATQLLKGQALLKIHKDRHQAQEDKSVLKDKVPPTKP